MEEISVVGVLLGLALALGWVGGGCAVMSTYEKDTYDCTLKCDGTHSLKKLNVCYCETE